MADPGIATSGIEKVEVRSSVRVYAAPARRNGRIRDGSGEPDFSFGLIESEDEPPSLAKETSASRSFNLAPSPP